VPRRGSAHLLLLLRRIDVVRGYNDLVFLGGTVIWGTVFQSIIILLIVAFVFRFIARVCNVQSRPAEPDDCASFTARLRPRPTLDAGAVALEEPHENDDDEKQ